jgi:hypothetical protein
MFVASVTAPFAQLGNNTGYLHYFSVQYLMWHLLLSKDLKVLHFFDRHRSNKDWLTFFI